MIDDIAAIEQRRLHELERKAALFGPNTDPAVLIEIQTLKNKHKGDKSIDRKQFVSGLDYDFLMNVVAAALVRLNAVEGNQKTDSRKRFVRQLIHDAWMIAITVMVLVVLILQLV